MAPECTAMAASKIGNDPAAITSFVGDAERHKGTMTDAEHQAGAMAGRHRK